MSTRSSKQKNTFADLVKDFWQAPEEAYFDQRTIAPVTGRSIKTLECDRCRKSGIPFRKVRGKILYQKKNVIEWIESYPLVSSTNEYKVVDKVGK